MGLNGNVEDAGQTDSPLTTPPGGEIENRTKGAFRPWPHGNNVRTESLTLHLPP